MSRERAIELPGWVIDDAASVRREVDRYRGLTPAELWRLTELCARDALWAARASGRLEDVLSYVEPLPETTAAALRRLRGASGRGREGARGDGAERG